jgi:trehalose/maltose hydrolase-like predicted phosphorylase
MSKKAKSSDPGWVRCERTYHPNDEALAATRCFLGNGLLGLRGSLDELGTKGVQGLYAAGVFRENFVRQFETADTYTRKRLIFDEEIMPHGAPVQQIQGLPDLLFCRIEIAGRVFRMWEGEVQEFERTLDLRQGTLVRRLRWIAKDGPSVSLIFERFCSWADPRLLWQRVTVCPESAVSVKLAPGIDPLLEPELEGFRLGREKDGWSGQMTCAGTGIAVAFAQRWRVRLAGTDFPGAGVWGEVFGRPACCYEADVAAGQELQLERVTAVAPDNHPAYRTPEKDLAAIVAEAVVGGYERARGESTAALGKLWEEADVTIDGPAEDQFATRYAIYQLLAAAPWRHDHISLGAKCLSGAGYNGHVFWDNEINILPFYQWVFPEVAANHCRYRHRLLGDARSLAAAEGRPGARYPWQSALQGTEQAPAFIRCSRTQIHVVADVAYAASRLDDVAGDRALEREKTAELVFECARYMRSRLSWNEAQARFDILGVGGPDEYHPVTDNNAYTNHLTAWLLAKAAEWADLCPAHAERCGVEAAERDDWRKASSGLYRPLEAATGWIPQCDGFHDLDETWEEVGGRWGGIGAEFDRCKALKQPDVLLLLTLFPAEFPVSVWRANWDYYERFIQHGSSLSPSIHALVAARVGLPQRALHYYRLAANFEFNNTNQDTHHGIHIGNCGGIWQALVFGFAGLRTDGPGLTLDPVLPAEWQALRFRVLFRGAWLRFEVRHDSVAVEAPADNAGPVRLGAFGGAPREVPPGANVLFQKS